MVSHVYYYPYTHKHMIKKKEDEYTSKQIIPYIQTNRLLEWRDEFKSPHIYIDVRVYTCMLSQMKKKEIKQQQ